MAKKSKKQTVGRQIDKLYSALKKGRLTMDQIIDAINAGGPLSAAGKEVLVQLVARHNCLAMHPAGKGVDAEVKDTIDLEFNQPAGVRHPGPAGSTGPEEANRSETSDDDDLVEAAIADNMTDKVMLNPNAIRDAEELVSVMVIDLKLHQRALDLLGGSKSASLFRLAGMFGGLPLG